jgi:hypothetical protein
MPIRRAVHRSPAARLLSSGPTCPADGGPTADRTVGEGSPAYPAGLDGTTRRLALRLLAEYGGWHAAKLEVLRNFHLSSARLETLQAQQTDDPRGLHREIRANLSLLKALNLED